MLSVISGTHARMLGRCREIGCAHENLQRSDGPFYAKPSGRLPPGRFVGGFFVCYVGYAAFYSVQRRSIYV